MENSTSFIQEIHFRILSDIVEDYVINWSKILEAFGYESQRIIWEHEAQKKFNPKLSFTSREEPSRASTVFLQEYVRCGQTNVTLYFLKIPRYELLLTSFQTSLFFRYQMRFDFWKFNCANFNATNLIGESGKFLIGFCFFGIHEGVSWRIAGGISRRNYGRIWNGHLQ